VIRLIKNVVYLRTSTEEQNPELQIQSILSLFDGDEYIVYKEQQSAFKDKDRVEFERIKKLINKRAFTDLYVWDLDRLFRNRLNLVDFFKYCSMKGVKIHSYRQKWLEDLNKAPSPWNEIMSDLLVQIMGWMAEEESTKKSARVKNAIRHKDGKTISYKGNKWGRKSLPKQTKDKIIELHLQGESTRSISGKVLTWKNGNSKNVSKSAVHKIIKEFNAKKESKL